MCLASLALAVAGCGGGGSSDSSKSTPSGGSSAGAGAAKSQVKVDIKSFKFNPDPIKVKAGGSVTWTNGDTAPHTAQTDSTVKGAFDTKTLKKGDSKKITFKQPGRYSYHCTYHRFMTGTVEVEK